MDAQVQASSAGPWAQDPATRAPVPEWSAHVAGTYLSAFARLRDLATKGRGHGPLRVAFVGQRSYFGVAAMPGRLPGLATTFIDHVSGSDPHLTRSAIEQFDPHVLIAFRPEVMGPVLDLVDVPIRIGMFTEPLLLSGWEGDPDLQRRTVDFDALDPTSCQHYIGFNPLFRPAWQSRVPILACMPLPVCDDIYIAPGSMPTPDARSGIFVGRVTPRRNRFLMNLKHRYDWTVIDHGMRSGLDQFSIGLNLHNEDYPNFENRVPLHLARGQLVLSEQLTPTFTLQEGVHLFTFDKPGQLVHLVEMIEREPQAARRVAIQGRLAAEDFRASRLWPDRLVDVVNTMQEG